MAVPAWDYHMVIKGKAQNWSFPNPKVWSVGLMSRGFRGISSRCALRYSTFLLTTAPLLFMRMSVSGDSGSSAGQGR